MEPGDYHASSNRILMSDHTSAGHRLNLGLLILRLLGRPYISLGDKCPYAVGSKVGNIDVDSDVNGLGENNDK